MLSGDNGILQKATDAKAKTERQSVVEQARTDVLGYQAKNIGGDLEKTQLKAVLDTYFKDAPDLTDMSDTEIKEKQLQTLPKYGTHTIIVSEIYNGKFTDITDDIQYDLAKDKLIVNTSASTDTEKSPYVNYIDANENSVLCRVLYNDSNRLEIVTVNSLTTILLGYNDSLAQSHGSTNSEKAQWSYNNAISTLNNAAMTYLNTELSPSEGARCVGSNPNNKNSESENFIFPDNYNDSAKSNQIKDEDDNYETDFNRLADIGALYSPDYRASIYPEDGGYWLASRYIDPQSSYYRFAVRRVTSDSTLSHNNFFYVMTSGYAGYNSYYSPGLRVVFRLKSDVLIKSGDGTRENPYILLSSST